MLILIILGALIVVGIVLLVVGRKCYFRYDYECSCVGIVSIIFGGIWLLVLSIPIIGVQATKEKDYQQALYEKQMLEYRIEERDDNVVGNELLYSDIVAFNNELRSCKTWSDSIWIGLFYNDKIATIEYIEIWN